MSISSQITRLQNAKSSLKTAINNKLASNPITDETIEDFADKVNDIVVPGGSIITGKLSSDTSKGKNLVNKNTIRETLDRFEKLDATHFIEFGYYGINLLEYDEEYDKLVNLDSIATRNTYSHYSNYYCQENGNYYVVVLLNSTDIAIIGTDLEEIWISAIDEGENIIEFQPYSSYFKQVDYNKFVNYKDDTTNKKVVAKAVYIDFENEKIKVGSPENIITTTNTYQSGGLEIIAQNRFAIYLCYKSGNNSVVSIKLCKVNDGTWNNNQSNIIQIRNNNTTISGSEYLPATARVKEGGNGILDVYDSFSSKGYFSFSDSSITFTSGSCPNANTTFAYDFSLGQVVINYRQNEYSINYDRKLYSVTGYTHTLIEDITDKEENSSPKRYKDANQKTTNNRILYIVTGIATQNIVVCNNSIAVENRRIYFSNSTSGNYISAENGLNGDTIKIYSPS